MSCTAVFVIGTLGIKGFTLTRLATRFSSKKNLRKYFRMSSAAVVIGA